MSVGLHAYAAGDPNVTPNPAGFLASVIEVEAEQVAVKCWGTLNS